MQHTPSGSTWKSTRPSLGSRRLSAATVVLLSIGAASSLVACGSDDTASTSDPTAADAAPSSSDEPATTTNAADGEPVIDPGDSRNYVPEIDPADFSATVDNPYLPFPVGATWIYEGTDGDEIERIEVVVLDEDKTVMGVPVVSVQDTVSDAYGNLIEDTTDWYAQDSEGNVWYFGETTAEYEDGEVVSTKGSWEAGVDGALPGIVMLADPAVGDAYRQEFYEGEAEDLGEVLRVGETTTIALGEYDDTITTEDWNPLDPEIVEEKTYAPGVGFILEVKTIGGEGRVELVEFTPGS